LLFVPPRLAASRVSNKTRIIDFNGRGRSLKSDRVYVFIRRFYCNVEKKRSPLRCRSDFILDLCSTWRSDGSGRHARIASNAMKIVNGEFPSTAVYRRCAGFAG
jgi:hypothetical protein